MLQACANRANLTSPGPETLILDLFFHKEKNNGEVIASDIKESKRA